MPLIETQNLSASYSGCRALERLSIAIEPGEIVGLCGPNKAGKSTLCKCLVGAVTPEAGKIFLDSIDISQLPTHRRIPLGISLCPEGRGLYPSLTVLDNLRLGANPLPKGERTARIAEVLNEFPILADKRKQTAATLSGGEAQQLAIARSLLRRPRLLIVDEPSLGLAPVAIASVFRTLSRIHKRFGVSILLVEESLSRLSGWAGRVYVLDRGLKIAEGSCDELANSAAVAGAFTGELVPKSHQNSPTEQVKGNEPNAPRQCGVEKSIDSSSIEPRMQYDRIAEHGRGSLRGCHS